MEITGTQFLAVYAHCCKKIHYDFKVFAAGLVICCSSGAVFMRGLHESQGHSGRFNVVRVDINCCRIIAVVKICSYRLVNKVNQFFCALFDGRFEIGMIAYEFCHFFCQPYGLQHVSLKRTCDLSIRHRRLM